ncbi:MAG: helix-turn-helix transcriptional regulator [Chitinophagaceae bacterium]|nr:helix-turn-helix transcriptional regulator [Chitinophagaceae bacterium]
MKAKPNPDRKRNEVNIVSTPLFSISFYRGAGSFSIHSQHQKNFPLALVMVCRGQSVSVKTSASLAVPIHINRCQLFFEKGLNPKFSYKGSENWEFFEIRMSPSLLNGLPIVCPAWNSFMKKLAKNKAAILSDLNIYYRNTLKDTAYSLLNEQFAELTLREKYFYVKVQEILLHVLQELLLSAEANVVATAKQQLLASKIKQILDKAQTSKDFTMQSLSKDLDTNETTLKQSFKIVTGTTIYQYYLHKQMKLAQQLLSNGFPVADIAIKVGYSTVGHFSHQFKKYFGTNPNNFRNRV